jgi:hypothetical protein
MNAMKDNIQHEEFVLCTDSDFGFRDRDRSVTSHFGARPGPRVEEKEIQSHLSNCSPSNTLSIESIIALVLTVSTDKKHAINNIIIVRFLHDDRLVGIFGDSMCHDSKNNNGGCICGCEKYQIIGGW